MLAPPRAPCKPVGHALHVGTMLAQEPLIRLSVFAAVLLAMVALEHAFPRRPQRLSWRRWPSNLGLVALSSLLLRLLAPAGAVGVALWAESQGLGLFRWIDAPFWVAAPVAVLLLDLLIYFQHRVFHAVPALWRLHRVHHADPELDASSGLRFHPVEILLSLAIKAVAVTLLGAPAEAVLVFEVLLNATALFNHANLALPAWVDRPLRWLLVTPDMHRVHHSEIERETNSDFGFCLSSWDRIFGTYIAEPEKGQLGMVIGIEGYRADEQQRLDRLLVQPFRPG
ncbi:sterol desaturase family protein [Roseomonas sp. PWR1]|uniref:Sterol desaturase family protein n=2 Tax=Roseomonas nitratireducens TaxID=2820810 RepID=A0ABS4AXR4_9PROT|nr:sterol desaturase family protein [Neoroseomonas nitratireducens]